MKDYRYVLEAEEGYAGAVAYYGRIQSELAGRFFEEIEPLVADARQARTIPVL